MPLSGNLDPRFLAVRRNLLRWAAGNLRDFPWRGYVDEPFHILIAEILLKRTTAKAAARVYVDFISDFPDLQSLAVALLPEVQRHLIRVGLHRQRAAAFKAMATYLLAVHGGTVPQSLEALRAVPGLGEYSARAVLSYGFNVPTAPVDSNVGRFMGRCFQDLLSPRPRLADFQWLADFMLPARRHRAFNFGVLDLAAQVCTPVAPKCPICPVRGQCASFKQARALKSMQRIRTRA